jgi:hypothetical protein
MYPVLLAVAAALGTITGLFLGMPAMGFVLWPLTRAVCRATNIEIDPGDEHDRVMKLEGSLAAGLGMALGVAGTAALVGLLTQAPQTLAASATAGGIAGLTFGALWRFGYTRRSAAPYVLLTALLSAASAALVAW